MPELGFYAMAGAPENPRELLVEAAEAERIGFGSAFLSERFNNTAERFGIRESSTLAGAVGAVTSRIGIATAATSHNLRHPVVAAAHAMTMHKLTGGRFSLGIARGGDTRNLGLAPVTTAQLADFAWLMRRLWAGETVTNHDGPAGRFPQLCLGQSTPERIPLTLAALGPKTLAIGGMVFDAVVLHPFFSEETTRRAVARVRAAAEKAGRDPAAVRIWAVLPTMDDQLPEAVQRRKTVGRLATHLQTNGDLLTQVNRWDPAVLDRFRRDLFVRSFHGPIGDRASDSELEHVETLLPPSWWENAAFGGRMQSVKAIHRQLALGADGVVLQGASPWELEPIVAEYRRCRDGARFERLLPNPAAVRRS